MYMCVYVCMLCMQDGSLNDVYPNYIFVFLVVLNKIKY